MGNNIKNVNNAIAPSFAKTDEIDSLKQRFRIVLNYRPKRNIFKIFNIALCSLALCLFISSYFIIIQPYYKPSQDETYKKEYEKNSFIIKNPEGNYDIYIDKFFKYSIKDLKDLNESLSDLPIIKEGVD